MKYLNNVLLAYQKFLNLILVNVTLQVDLVAVYIEIKVSVVMPFLLMLNLSEYLEKHLLDYLMITK